MVALIEEDDLVPRLKLAHQQANHSRHPTGVEDGFLGTFEVGELAFDDLLVRVTVTTIFFSILLLFDEVDDGLCGLEGEGTRADDRICDRVAKLLSGFTGMNASSTYGIS